MKKIISLLALGTIAPFMAFASGTTNIAVSHVGQAYLNFPNETYVSDDYYLYTFGDGKSPIYFEFDISSLKTYNIESASITFTWGGSFGPATSPAWASISKGNASSALTGNAANDVNNAILSVGNKLANITSGTQDEVYSLDITSYLSSAIETENYISFAVNGFAVSPIIYSVDNSSAAVKPQLIVQYSNVIPEPSAYAAIFGSLALVLVLFRKRKG